jgi:curli biogenesis system outer membrane secretion channel CsgG
MLVPLSGTPQAATEPQAERVTNAQVVAMIKAGLPEDVIIASIQGQPSSFDTSPDALIGLKSQGATDALIRAMVAAAQVPPPDPAPAGEMSPAARPLVDGQHPPTVAVMDFDYGTVNNWWGHYDIGRGMADQVVNGLVNDGTFRVIERKHLDTVLGEQDFSQSDRAAPSAAELSRLGRALGVRYIIAGSVTRFGTEEKNFGTGGLPLGLPVPVGMFSFKKKKTYVTLTARVIDATTGQIITSVKGEGLSKKGGGLGLAGGGSGFFGVAGMDTPTFKESAVGEAQELACKNLINELIAKKEELKR